MSRARDTADGIARAITDGIVVDADINASAAIAQSKVANLETDIGEKISGDGIENIVALTQAEYDALTPVATTLYVVTD
jgi:hypothetical protein